MAQDLVKDNFSGDWRICSVIKRACNLLRYLALASSVKNYADTIGKPSGHRWFSPQRCADPREAASGSLHRPPACGSAWAIRETALGTLASGSWPAARCNGLQSKPARPAISAFSGPHYLQLAPVSGPHYLQLRLHSSAWACNPSHQDHILCIWPSSQRQAILSYV